MFWRAVGTLAWHPRTHSVNVAKRKSMSGDETLASAHLLMRKSSCMPTRQSLPQPHITNNAALLVPVVSIALSHLCEGWGDDSLHTTCEGFDMAYDDSF